MRFANRLKALSGNVFVDMDQAKAEAISAGKTIIDLSLGSSDLQAPNVAIAAIEKSLHDPTTHGYLLYHGTLTFREAVAKWYTHRFDVEIDPQTEVLLLIGSQEGTGHLPLAILNPQEIALLLDPGYPSYAGGVYLAGGQIHTMPLLAENQFLPVLADIPTSVLAKARLMVLNYPHNPTTSMASLSFFEETVKFCQQHDLVLVHDFPYADIVFDEIKSPPSILQADPNKSSSIEFFTFSKSYNMGGFRIGFAVGNAELVTALRKIKAIIDFNQYRGVLDGAIAALEGSQETVKQTVAEFQKRRDVFIKALNNINWLVESPQATMYVWAKLPEPWQNKSTEFCRQLVLKTGVAVSPGAGFGKQGEGYVRFALVHNPDVLEVAVKQIAGFLGETL
ncbi:MAG: LL-diaminopimelate aminotransferase [cyanobacterium endosymbiont of Rhopalodia musculus]|uniref:LL-diaminopimelate aminotransferase n=1 Tax=cyanobacterium endosymbiont of Epithemia clementina EcSB TaxID=3034674 RepID=UPI0024810681|nr:LL-diaminopimelate aminotransferase [cyanobacterium endosymbiont of Epithemia clementina EcSB]WGT66695.1 LL-diaminopimelate aminotransferase [cyanobacterium endosymbiont of Epithemia clementina EcSB]